MLRLLFSKTGNAIWISHLDTMRLFQRAFKRCGFHLKHTQGFNPRPSVSIALPLSVGVESFCELLDFELDDEIISYQNIRDKLNNSLIDGIRVMDVYDTGTKLKYLKYLHCEVDLDFNHGVPCGAAEAIRELFRRTEIWMDKKSKNGVTTQNISPMIRSIDITCPNDNRLRMDAVISCQEPSLNPSQLSAAVEKYLSDYAFDFVRCRRCELLDADAKIFR